MKSILFAAVVIAVAGTTLTASLHAQPGGKVAVKTADDLPRFTYEVKGKALEILGDAAQLKALVDRFDADIDGVLAKYDIQDKATLRGLYDAKMQVAVYRGDLAKALDWTLRARDLETKEAEKLTRGIALRARIAATDAAKGDEATFAQVFKRELTAQLRPLPLPVIKDRLIAVRNQAKIVNKTLVESSISNSIDPVLAANKGQAPAEVVGSLLSARNTLDSGLRLLPLMAEVYGQILDAGAGAKEAADLWTPRLVTLAPNVKATPVIIAVWDSGVDTSLFGDQLWTNPREQADGKDNDANGFTDDLHGIAFDKDHRPTTGSLTDLSGLRGDKATLMGYIAASQDMQAGIENEGVRAFRERYSSLSGEALRDFTDDLSLMGGYVHGTHVAGIASAGNPFARILHVTENWPYKSIPDAAPTLEEYRRWGDSTKQTVAYLKSAGVRVVNMSWRIPRSAVEGMLEIKGVGASRDDRARMSREIFAQLHDGLRDAIASAPDILFVAGAGNEDNDLDFSEYIPAGLRLPNLITVGAVDDHDKPASFTTTGKDVTLFSNGYRIENVVPGGQKIKLSGTSMASPQVANLAGKILALRPELRPAEVLRIIRDTADPLPDMPGRFIINPKRAIETLGH